MVTDNGTRAHAHARTRAGSGKNISRQHAELKWDVDKKQWVLVCLVRGTANGAVQLGWWLCEGGGGVVCECVCVYTRARVRVCLEEHLVCFLLSFVTPHARHAGPHTHSRITHNHLGKEWSECQLYLLHPRYSVFAPLLLVVLIVVVEGLFAAFACVWDLRGCFACARALQS